MQLSCAVGDDCSKTIHKEGRYFLTTGEIVTVANVRSKSLRFWHTWEINVEEKVGKCEKSSPMLDLTHHLPKSAEVDVQEFRFLFIRIWLCMDEKMFRSFLCTVTVSVDIIHHKIISGNLQIVLKADDFYDSIIQKSKNVQFNEKNANILQNQTSQFL